MYMSDSPENDEGSPYPTRLNKMDFLVPGSDPPRFYCPGCGQERAHSSWNDHQRKGCASRASRPSTIPCPECDKTFSLRKKMTEHYYKEHGPVLVQQRKFVNQFQLAKFKNNLEIESGFKFQNRGLSGKTMYFVCKMGYKKALVKNNGSTSCTAFLNVSPLDDGQFLVQYCNYHIHEPSNKETEIAIDEPESDETEDCGDLILDLNKYDERTQELKPGVIKMEPTDEVAETPEDQPSTSNAFDRNLKIPKEEVPYTFEEAPEVAIQNTGTSAPSVRRIFIVGKSASGGGGVTRTGVPIHMAKRACNSDLTDSSCFIVNGKKYRPLAPGSVKPDPPQIPQNPSPSQKITASYNEFLKNVPKPHRHTEFITAEKNLIELEYMINKHGTTSMEAQRAMRLLTALTQTVDELKHKFTNTGTERAHVTLNRKRSFLE